jgi:hypothetical protein
MRTPVALLVLALTAGAAFAQQSTPAPSPAPNPTTDSGQPSATPAIPEKIEATPPDRKGPPGTIGESTRQMDTQGPLGSPLEGSPVIQPDPPLSR